MNRSDEMRRYLEDNRLTDKMANAVHIAWATGVVWFLIKFGKNIVRHIFEEWSAAHSI